MRTTYKMLKNLTKLVSEETGTPYVVDSHAPGLYNVAHTANGFETIIAGKANECYYALQAIRRHVQHSQRKPQFVIVVADGIVQTVLKVGTGEVHYLLIDEDAIGIAANEHLDFEDIQNMTKNQILADNIAEGMKGDTFLRVSDAAIENTTAETINKALGYDNPN